MICTGRERILWTLCRIVKKESATEPRGNKNGTAVLGICPIRGCKSTITLEHWNRASHLNHRTTPSSGELAVA